MSGPTVADAYTSARERHTGSAGAGEGAMADDGEHEPSRTGGPGAGRLASSLESPAQIVGAALGSAAVVGFLLAHSVQYGVAVLVALLFLPIALLNLPLAIGLFVPLIYLEQVPGRPEYRRALRS